MCQFQKFRLERVRGGLLGVEMESGGIAGASGGLKMKTSLLLLVSGSRLVTTK